MSSPEYLRRHYGVVPPQGEAPRFSTPSNLSRRTAEVTGIYEQRSLPIPITPVTKLEHAKPTIIPVSDEHISVGIAWTKRKASGVRTTKNADWMNIPVQVPDVYFVPTE